MFFEQKVPVLVSEDTIYRREDHSKRLLLYGRPYLPGQPFNRLYSPRPSPSLFYDTFVGVYPVQEQYSQSVGSLPPPASQQPFFLLKQGRPAPFLFEDKFVSVIAVQEAYSQITPLGTNPPQPAFLYFTSNRPRPELFEDHSLDTGQTNHVYPHVIQIGIGLYPYTFETPDLCMDIWQEQVPLHQAVNMYPYRQIYPKLPPQQIMLQMFYQPPDWHLEAEPLWHVPATNNDTLHQFRWQIIIPTLPNVVGLTQAAAIALLNFDNFFNVSVVFLPSITVPAGIVISQVPAPGIVSGFNIPVLINVSIGFLPSGTVAMPNVVGMVLDVALGVLEKAGVLVPSKIGYFGTYPISVIWIPSLGKRKDAAYIADWGIVHAQSAAPGAAVVPNAPLTLTVSSFPDNVAFP